MEIRPLILGALFIVLVIVLFNPPTGGGKHDDQKGKGGDKKH